MFNADAIDAVVKAIVESAPALRLEGVYTHLAVADEPDNEFTGQQLAEFDAVLASLETPPIVHAANSAGGLAHPAARRSFVRLGIAMYGLVPGPGVGALVSPTCVRRCRSAPVCLARQAGRRRRRAISYGLRHTFPCETTWRPSRSAMPTECLAGCRCSADRC